MTWELEVRPRRTTVYAAVVAAVLVVGFGIAGILLRSSSTGVGFDGSDQAALIILGILLGGAVLLLARPRLRVNADGADVRNILGEKHIEWDLMRGLSFPDGARSPRIELPDDEYVTVRAIQANDGIRAAEAVERFRELGAKYAPVQK